MSPNGMNAGTSDTNGELAFANLSALTFPLAAAAAAAAACSCCRMLNRCARFGISKEVRKSSVGGKTCCRSNSGCFGGGDEFFPHLKPLCVDDEDCGIGETESSSSFPFRKVRRRCILEKIDQRIVMVKKCSIELLIRRRY
jgi:hypothetical protein